MQTVNFEELIKIQAKGVITIPKNLRRNLFEDNSIARVKREKGRLIIEPVRTLAYPVRSYTDSEIKEFTAFDLEESRELKKKGLL